MLSYAGLEERADYLKIDKTYSARYLSLGIHTLRLVVGSIHLSILDHQECGHYLPRA